MSFASKTLVNPVPARGLSLFTISKDSYASPCLSVPFKPIKFNLSCSHHNFLYPRKKETHVRVSVISAQREENNPVALEEEEQGLDANFNWDASEGECEGRESVGYVEPNDEAKVYVGNLPYSVDSENLARIFEEAGVVDVAEVIYSKETGQSRGFGFVTMSSVEEAERAVQMFHRNDVDGRPLTVNIAAPKGSRPELAPRLVESSLRIYVGNLPWSVDSSRLKEIFSEYGKVVLARVISDMESGRSRGFGFVEMSSQAEMNDAISNLDGQTLDGRAIRVNVAADRRRSSF